MKKVTASEYKARFRRRSTHVPNLTDELSTAKDQSGVWINLVRHFQFGAAKALSSKESVELLSNLT